MNRSPITDPRSPPPKTAIVHEWLASYAGSERVLEQMLAVYPHADLYAVCDFLPAEERAFLNGHRPATTFIQRLPFARKRFRGYLPLMPLAVEQLDLSGYELVLSSSHAVAKGVITGPDQLHVSYVHSPMRYAWDLQHQYLAESGLNGGPKSWAVRALLHRLRRWDQGTANGVDAFIANSRFIARRIAKVYRRSSEVIYPPVDVERFTSCAVKDDYYLIASRMVPYKKVPLIIEAFARMPAKRLVVIGDGPEVAKARVAASGAANIELLGRQPQAVLAERMQHARAFVFAAEEDFGITAVEAQACGTPVIAYGRGGSLETVLANGDATTRTGLWFEEQSVESIIAAVRTFESLPVAPSAAACRANAQRFAPEVFRAALRASVQRAYEAFGDGMNATCNAKAQRTQRTRREDS